MKIVTVLLVAFALQGCIYVGGIDYHLDEPPKKVEKREA